MVICCKTDCFLKQLLATETCFEKQFQTSHGQHRTKEKKTKRKNGFFVIISLTKLINFGVFSTRSQHHPVSPYRSNLESTSHSATSSSSCESSLDSLNSSILQLLHDGHVYAASIERYTCAALRCITLLLLLCPAVGDFILVPQPLLNARANAFSSTSGNSSTAEGDGKV